MPFSCFLGGLGQQNGRKGVLKPPHLLTNYVCNRRVTAIVSRQRARPPTYLPQRVRLSINYAFANYCGHVLPAEWVPHSVEYDDLSTPHASSRQRYVSVHGP